jgi:D-alanyl-D-alanine carboxypeptidase
VLRQTAGDGLVSVDGVVMQPEAAEAWQALEADARAAGYQFIVSSAYRSVATQKWWFNTQLDGTSDEAIDAALRWYSVPGTSKHHSGYALDFRYANGTFGEFRDTPDYAWLSADNFRVAKEHGFIPSYPDDVEFQGPNPEPWEFVWVGTDLIRCGVPLDLSQSAYAGWYRWIAAEGVIECPGGVTVSELDWMLRTLGPKVEALLNA